MTLTDPIQSPQPASAFAALRRFIRERQPVDRCELCSAALSTAHQHLIEPVRRKLLCACDACAILFESQEGQYRRVPQRIRYLADFRLSNVQWESLMIPINMAFFFHCSPAGRVVAIYPSPAGPTESLLTLESWDEIAGENCILKEMESDVEALLVNRVSGGPDQLEPEYYLAPIDECYKLTGLIRAHWRGLAGGTEVWSEIRQFFSGLKERSTVIKRVSCA